MLSMIAAPSQILAIALLLTACSMPPAVVSRIPVLEQLNDGESLPGYHQWLSQADAATLDEAREAHRQSIDASASDRVRHALLLSVDDNAPTEDLQTARRLLSDVLTPDSALPDRHRDFARLWNDMVTLRLQLRETLARQAHTIDSLEQRNRQLQRDNEELRRQIDALTVIEQQLNRRERQEPES